MTGVISQISMILTVILCPLVISVNGFAISILIWSKKLRKKPSIILILNLLCTHFVQGFIVMPVYVIRKTDFQLGTSSIYVCDIWRMTYMLTFYATCINVLLVAVDRFLAVRCGLLYKSMFRYKHFILASFVSWTYLLILCVIPFFNAEPSSCNYTPQRQWTIFMLFTNTIMPYALVIVFYSYIVKSLKKNTKKVSNVITPIVDENNGMEDNKKVSVTSRQHNEVTSTGTKMKPTLKRCSYNRKVTVLSLKITVIYGLTWAPSIIYYLITSLTPHILSNEFYTSNREAIVTFIFKYVTLFDGLLAPFLYCYFHNDFRSEIRRFIDIIKGNKLRARSN